MTKYAILFLVAALIVAGCGDDNESAASSSKKDGQSSGGNDSQSSGGDDGQSSGGDGQSSGGGDGQSSGGDDGQSSGGDDGQSSGGDGQSSGGDGTTEGDSAEDDAATASDGSSSGGRDTVLACVKCGEFVTAGGNLCAGVSVDLFNALERCLCNGLCAPTCVNNMCSGLEITTECQTCAADTAAGCGAELSACRSDN
jgi:hypothetical protein